MGVVAVEVVEAVAEECHHQDPEEQDMRCLSLHTRTANCTAKALTSLQETNGRPDDTPATPLDCRCLKSRILQSIPTTELTPCALAAHTESAHQQMQHVWAQLRLYPNTSTNRTYTMQDLDLLFRERARVGVFSTNDIGNYF